MTIKEQLSGIKFIGIVVYGDFDMPSIVNVFAGNGDIQPVLNGFQMKGVRVEDGKLRVKFGVSDTQVLENLSNYLKKNGWEYINIKKVVVTD